MGLRDTMLAGGITGLALFGAELALTGDAPLQLRLDFGAASLLHRVGASAHEQSVSDDEEERPGLHPLILESELTKANERCSGACSEAPNYKQALEIKRLYKSSGFGYPWT